MVLMPPLASISLNVAAATESMSSWVAWKSFIGLACRYCNPLQATRPSM